jgi:hypothetical protein
LRSCSVPVLAIIEARACDASEDEQPSWLGESDEFARFTTLNQMSMTAMKTIADSLIVRSVENVDKS